MLLLAMSAIMVVAGCKKKQAPAVPPTPPPAPLPTASIAVSPDNIQRGSKATLTWSAQNAETITINGDKVDAQGSKDVEPTTSTTYTLDAANKDGKTTTAAARLTVVEPPAPKAEETPSTTDADQFAQNVKDIYFNFDRYDLRKEDQATVEADVAYLKAHPGIKFTIEGHCDDRGSSEYNLALGDNRANAVRNALIKAGIAADQIKVISYGKEKPFCSEENDSCWQQNRRDHFVFGH